MGSDEELFNMQVQELTLAFPLDSLVDAKTADVLVSGNFTVNAGVQAGIVMSLDAVVKPGSFLLCYHDGHSVKLEKYVAGKYEMTVVTFIVTYVPGAQLLVVKEGAVFSIYYNGERLGSPYVLPDTEIIYNTLFGTFFAYTDNPARNFAVHPRGTDGEYNALSTYGSKIGKDQTKKYVCFAILLGIFALLFLLVLLVR